MARRSCRRCAHCLTTLRKTDDTCPTCGKVTRAAITKGVSFGLVLLLIAGVYFTIQHVVHGLTPLTGG